MEAIMLTQLFPKYHPHYTHSPAAHWLEGFSDWLTARGYARRPAQRHLRRLKTVLECHRCVSVTGRFSAAALPRMFADRERTADFRGTQRAFQRFLIERGSIRIESRADRFSEVLTAYRAHLIELRGLAPATTGQHLVTAAAFLAAALPRRRDLQALSAEAVERFVVVSGHRVTRQTLQHTVAHLRAFLRYCHNHGFIEERLDAIDTPRTYRDELPPRAIDWALVQRLLDSIDVTSKAGWRDLTMLHLMAHYGLRPSEIAALTVGAIDWPMRSVRVEQRKTRSSLLLPLTDRTLLLLKRYLRHGRPSAAHPELFLRVRTPAGPLTNYAVGDVFRKRARDSGLPLNGYSCYGLRHAFAMRLLNRGVGIKAIGDLLGHRSLESTCVYLRLQTDALREVALPLPSVERRRGRPS
jgi:site-specific recombinase XerD